MSILLNDVKLSEAAIEQSLGRPTISNNPVTVLSAEEALLTGMVREREIPREVAHHNRTVRKLRGSRLLALNEIGAQLDYIEAKPQSDDNLGDDLPDDPGVKAFQRKLKREGKMAKLSTLTKRDRALIAKQLQAYGWREKHPRPARTPSEIERLVAKKALAKFCKAIQVPTCLLGTEDSQQCPGDKVDKKARRARAK